MFFFFRILGRLCDPLDGVHDELLGGHNEVVPGCAGLSNKQYKLSMMTMTWDVGMNSTLFFSNLVVFDKW